VTRVIDVAPDLEIRTPTEQDVAAAVKESPSTEESSP
jgi:hypothetical protein